MRDSITNEWVICGRVIGNAFAWDAVDDLIIVLYGFNPGIGYQGPVDKSGEPDNFDIEINFGAGTIKPYTELGVLHESADLLTSIIDCPQKHVNTVDDYE